MTNHSTEILNANVSKVKDKLKSVEYNYVIDKYVTSQNIIIIVGFIFFFILMLSLITAFQSSSSQRIEVELSKIDLIEKSIDELHNLQESIQVSLLQIVEALPQLQQNKTSKQLIVVDETTAIDREANNIISGILSGGELDLQSNDNNKMSGITESIAKNELLSNVRVIMPTDDIEQPLNVSKVESSFAYEKIDNRWRNKIEAKIIAVLEQQQYQQNWFDKLECRSSICKLEITHDTNIASNRFIRDFPVQLTGFKRLLNIDPMENGKTITTYYFIEKEDYISARKNSYNAKEHEADTEKATNPKKAIKKAKLKIEDKFKGEKSDPRWSSLIKFKIKTVLHQKKFRNTWFDKLVCKTSVCKLVITHKKIKLSKIFIKQFPRVLKDFDSKKSKIIKQKNGNYKTTLYLQQRL